MYARNFKGDSNIEEASSIVHLLLDKAKNLREGKEIWLSFIMDGTQIIIHYQPSVGDTGETDGLNKTFLYSLGYELYITHVENWRR